MWTLGLALAGWTLAPWTRAEQSNPPEPPDTAVSHPVPPIATGSNLELVRGQKGYGLSVFRGSEPERFDVEVLGVLHKSTPELSYILTRLTGQDLERSGVVAGMSGSPVYVDGQLVGAVAYSYLYGLDAIAGVTPIDAMRRLNELPTAAPGVVPAAAGGLPEWRVSFDDLVRRDFAADQLARQLEQLAGAARTADGGAAKALQWTAGGFGAGAAALLDRGLGGVARVGATAGSGGGAGGAGASGGADELVPGGSVAVVLVQGDLNLAAHGTVTDRQGDEVIAFGHPVFSLGPVNVPMATSEVVTVVANVSNSFKVSNAGPVVGAFDQDRQAGMRGRLGLTAPTTPLRVKIRGMATRDYRMEVSDLGTMRPLLLAISTFGAVDAATYAGGYQGLDLDARFHLAGHEDLRVRQSFDGFDAPASSVMYLLSFGAFLDFNEYEKVTIEGVDVEVTQVERPRSATLVAAHPERQLVRPGERVPVTLDLQPYRGERFRLQTEVEIAESAPVGRYTVFLGDGTSMDALRLTLERRAPETFAQALRLMQSFHSRRDLVIYGLVPGPGLAVAGAALPDLPGSVRSIFSAGGTPPRVPLTLAIAREQTETLELPIDGVVRIDFEVRHRG